MKHKTILFISTQKISGNSVLAAVKATGYRVVSTTSTQAVALLFIMHCAAAVLLDRGESEENSFDLARNLRAICHDVPIILLSPTTISPLSSHIDACVSTALPLTNLTSAVLQVLAMVEDCHRRTSLRKAA
jgi:CheY-like chemotaxis protein